MPRLSTLHKANNSDPNQPLHSPQRERFAIAIADGLKLQDAHKSAGFKGQSKTAAWSLRQAPDIDARVKAILKKRVDSSNRGFARRQKRTGDLLEQTVKRLSDIAFTDPGELMAWETEPATMRQRLRLRDSSSIPAGARAAIKGAFMKGDSVRLELHDTRAALVDLAKLLIGKDIAQTPSVNVTQVNVGGVDAVQAAQRVAFLLAAASHRLPAPRTIDAEPVQDSKDADADPKR